MDKQQEMEKRLMDLSEELGHCGSFNAMLYWDSGTFCPPGGQLARARLHGYLTKLTQRTSGGAEARELVDYFESHEPGNEIQRAVVRELKKQILEGEKLGKEWRVRFAELTSIGKSRWIEARTKEDYSIYAPTLSEIFTLAREKGRLLGTAHPMDAFIDDWDRGVTVGSIDPLFEELKEGLAELLKNIRESGIDCDDSLLHIPLDKNQVARCAQAAAKAIGYDTDKGGFFETIHAFAGPIAPTDARICTNYDNFSGFFGTIHEAGHAIYHQCVPEELRFTNLRTGWPGSIHESQSLFYENIVAKSMPFTSWYMPMVRKEIPEFKDVSTEEMYRMANRVQPGYHTDTSDEVTSTIRPLLNYEVEKKLFDGSLDVKDMPEYWNSLAEKYYGTRPEKLSDGPLRSMQWSIGALGFFQSYTLGGIIDGQLREKMLADDPECFNRMAEGDMDFIRIWLGGHIHRYQKVLLPQEILKNAIGGELSVKPYLSYLREKYGELYKF